MQVHDYDMSDKEFELLEGTLRVTITLRGTFSEAVQACVQVSMRKQVLGRHGAIIESFKNSLGASDWKNLEDVLAQCALLFQKEQLEEKIRQDEKKR
jgi:hypothetical protein